MEVESLLALPQMDLVLEMQRELSRARTEHELIHQFATRFSRLSGAELVLDLDVAGLPAGAFRVRDRIVLAAGSEQARTASRWHEPPDAVPVVRSERLSPLLAGDAPTMIRGLPTGDDPHLFPGLDQPVDALLVPVFHGGTVTEWLLVVAPAGTPVDPAALRMAIANLNLLSRAIAQLRLNERVQLLTRRLEQGLEEVARIQRAILPALPAVPGLEIAVHYRPATIAGGDYYDFQRFDDGTLGIVIADVAGHGPGAAVVMAMLRTIMSAYRLGGMPPKEVVSYANRLLIDGLAPGAFVTTVFVALDAASGEGVFFNCGHCQPRLLDASGRATTLEAAGGPPLGILPDLAPEPGAFRLARGERLLLFTDGIVEAPARGGGERFGTARLEQLASIGPSPQAGVAALAAALEAFSGDAPRRDDECALLLARV